MGAVEYKFTLALRVVSYYRLDGMCFLMYKLWYDKIHRGPNLTSLPSDTRGYQSSTLEIGSLYWTSRTEDINSLTEAHKGLPWVKVCVQTRQQCNNCRPCH